MDHEDIVVAWDVEKTGRARQYPVCAVGACCLRWQHHRGNGPAAIEVLETEAWSSVIVPRSHEQADPRLDGII